MGLRSLSHLARRNLGKTSFRQFAIAGTEAGGAGDGGVAAAAAAAVVVALVVVVVDKSKSRSRLEVCLLDARFHNLGRNEVQ